MGGRLDSTNVIDSPVASVITGVAIDHVSVLGSTVGEIAKEKAGIIKQNRPVIYGGRDDVAFEVIRGKAKDCKSEIVRTEVGAISVKEMSVEGTVFDYGELKDVKLSLCGSYQPENAITVIETVRVLNREGFEISESALREGLKSAKWRARFELLGKEPTVIFDGSHNMQGVKAAAESVKRFFGNEKVLLLMGVLADKEWKAMLDELLPLAERMYCVTPNSPRALDSEILAKECNARSVTANAFDSIDDGVKKAYNDAKTQNVPLVMLGSLYMYGDVFKALENAKKK
jgi:dihydrofolate synthase/folylpolyglutamate synthase